MRFRKTLGLSSGLMVQDSGFRTEVRVQASGLGLNSVITVQDSGFRTEWGRGSGFGVN
jgi:hypothetical protein